MDHVTVLRGFVPLWRSITKDVERPVIIMLCMQPSGLGVETVSLWQVVTDWKT